MKQGPDNRIAIAVPLLTMALLGLVFGCIGYFYLKNQTWATEQQVHSRLSIAVKAKAVEIATWRSERIGDALVVSTAFHLLPLLQHVMAGHATAEERHRATELLETVKKQSQYAGVTLTDTQGATLLFVGSSANLSEIGPKLRTANFSDSFFGPIQKAGTLQINVVAKIRNEQGRPSGFVILTIDPRRWLLPVLADWQDAGRSGHLNLVKQNGGGLLGDEPAADIQTMLKEDAPVDGTDNWSASSTLSVASAVPDSDWHIVARVDRRDAFTAYDANTRLLVSLIIVSMLLGGAAVEILVRRRSRRFVREKNKAELEHNALRGRYDSLNRYASDAILIWDESEYILEANDSALKLFGYERDEMVGKNLRLLKPPGYGEEYLQNVRQIRPNQAVVFETIDMRKNGEAFPAEVSSCLIEIDGRFWGQSFIRDITERKRAEEQIIRLNRIYAVLSRCNYAAFRAQDENDLFQSVCQIAVEDGGFRIGFIGRVDTEAEVVRPIAVKGPASDYLREITVALDGPVEGISSLSIKQGKPVACTDFEEDPRMERWREAARRYGLRSSISLPVMRNGNAAFLFGIYSGTAGFFSPQEISLAEEVGICLSEALDRFDLRQARQQAQRERELAIERLERAFEIAHEGYWDWIIPTNEHYASPRFYALMGYESGEVPIDIDFIRDSVHPDERFVFVEKHQSLWNGEIDHWTARYRVRHKAGHYVWVQARAGVVSRDENGRPTRIVKTRLDISEQKLLELEFLQAQKMETVGRLAGSVAHDFNNHLTVMVGYSQLLREGLPEGSAMSEILGTIIESGDRAAALTRQLLAFSRKEVERREAIRPNKVITDIYKMLSHLTGERVQLTTDLDPAVGFVMMDRTHLEQIIMNLTVNARDAIEVAGTVRIITRVVQTRGLNHLRLSVTDNGCGMTPEIRAHIFEPFFTTRHHLHGTGLGLATVHGIVERSDGYIEVESEPGCGTALHIYIPALDNHESVELIEGEPQSHIATGQIILVVEDEEPVRRMAATALRRYGYRPLVARSGAEALALMGSTSHIEAALIDLIMPDMKGSDLAETIRKLRPEIKILYASGYADEMIQLAELLTNGAAFLPKPYKPDALAIALTKLLAEQVQRLPDATSPAEANHEQCP